MKKTVLAVILAIMLWGPQVGQAQTVYSSNLGDTPASSFTVANDSWIAQEITWEGYIVNGVMLTPDCTLNSVQLQMDAASGNPGGFTVSIYTAGPSGPGKNLGTLIGNSNPNNPSVYTYTTPGITLLPANSYFVVVDSTTSSAQGAYNWSVTTSGNEVSSGLTIDGVTGYLGINDEYEDSTDGLSWSSHIRQDIAQMAIYGTPVPEPSLWPLFVCGVGIIHCLRRRWQSAKSA